MNNSSHLAWEDGFPAVYGQTSVSFLKHCPGFNEAKCGDMRAAINVVDKCINPKTAVEIRRKYPDAVLLPVITDNKLPEALANKIGMKTYTGVHEVKTLNRKSLTAMERLLHKPVFSGAIAKGEKYIIVDDIITQGGTVSELRKYVIENGASVSAIVALSCSVGSNVLAPDKEDVFSLINKFSPHPIANTLTHYNIASDPLELTRAQIRYLLLFNKLEGLTDKIEKTQTALCW